MKKLNLLALFALSWATIACNQMPSVVIKPTVGVATTTTIGIDTVELTPTATILSIKAEFRPKQWIQIASETHLRVGEEQFVVDSSKNIELSTKFFMPESGKHEFKLYFPALPKGTKSFDLIESETVEGAFNLYGVDLTGKKSYGEPAKGIPSSVRRATLSDEIPEPKFEVGKTTLNLHVAGYDKRAGINSAKLTLNTYFYSDNEDLELPIDDDGNASIELTLSGPTRFWLVFGNLRTAAAQGSLFAGETADIYVDLRELSRRKSLLHKDEPSTTPAAYFTGESATLNTADALFCTLRQQDTLLQFNPYSNDEEFYPALLEMSVGDYFKSVIEDADSSIAAIDASALPAAAKEIGRINIQAYAMLKMFMYKSEYNTAYRKVNNIPWSVRKLDYSAPTATAEDFALLKRYNLNNPKSIYCPDGKWLYTMVVQQCDEYRSALSDDKDGLLFELNSELYSIINDVTAMNPLTDEQQSYLDSMDNQFYNEAIKVIQTAQREKIAAAKAKEGFTVCPTPDVANEKLFDAIAANYKGKVVFVDFWATWCGPCVASMKAMEPVKEQDLLDNEDIAFVYISSESSPRVKWETFISDIKGDHYYLTSEQWQYISKQFEIIGIPSYAIIQKDGKYSLRNDLRGSSDEVKNELLKQAAN